MRHHGQTGAGSARIPVPGVLLAVFLLMAGLAGCTPTYTFHGYTPEETELEQLRVGRSGREDVLRLVGQPSSTGVVGEDTWYYVSSQVRHLTYNAPEVVDRQVVAISFNRAGRISNIERFTLEDGQVVALSRRVTETSIRGVSFIGQLLRGIGRVRAEDILN